MFADDGSKEKKRGMIGRHMERLTSEQSAMTRKSRGFSRKNPGSRLWNLFRRFFPVADCQYCRLLLLLLGNNTELHAPVQLTSRLAGVTCNRLALAVPDGGHTGGIHAHSDEGILDGIGATL